MIVNSAKFSVLPFESLNVDFLTTPIINPLPLYPMNQFNFPHMDVTSNDPDLTCYLIVWLNGKVSDGKEGQIFRNDGLLYSLMYLADLNGSSRKTHEDSTMATTRSDATLLSNGIPIVNIEEKDISIIDAMKDLKTKFVWIPNFHKLPFVFGIAITKTQFQIVSLHLNSAINYLFSRDITHIIGRWECVLAIVNIARAIKYFTINNMYITSSLTFAI